MTVPRQSFHLTGPSQTLDPRVNAVRGDLADIALAGILFAPHYAAPVERRCAAAFAPMFDKPNGVQTSELLQAELFQMFDVAGGWAWGYSVHDHYVGYVQADALVANTALPSEPSGTDPVSLAETFIGMTYHWGGRGGAGIDCSGLIQRALAAAGIAAPRDSDMQQDALGTALAEGETLKRGDLIFFPGHVGIMADANTLVHATRHHGKTLAEPLADVIARIANDHSAPVLARKRIAR